jgi:hypothetical protein
MSDPIRLKDLDSAESEAERELLATSRADAPPSGARNRALAALGVAGSATLVTSTVVESANHGLRLASVLKVLGVFALAAAIGTFAYETKSPPRGERTQAPASVGAQIDTPVPIPTPIASTIAPNPVNSAISSVTPLPSASAPNKTHAPKAISAGDEIAWIDRAQKALADDPAKARRIVDAYRHDVSPRAYDEEATAIAAEASAKLGDHDRATREAKAFLATYPSSAYRDRVQAILASP